MQKETVVDHLNGQQWSNKSIFYLVVATTLAQGLHMVEHATQVYQHAILGYTLATSHGLVFFLDFEWNHFVFDIFVYLSLLTVIFFKAGIYNELKTSKFRNLRTNGYRELFIAMFAVGLITQGYHGAEHVIRVYQFTTTVCAPCLGFLGNYIDNVYLHAGFNTIVYALTTIAMIGLGFFNRGPLKR